MSRLRKPADKDAEKAQPHEPDRTASQPYNKEHEDYSGSGVVKPPEEKIDKRGESSPPRKP